MRASLPQPSTEGLVCLPVTFEMAKPEGVDDRAHRAVDAEADSTRRLESVAVDYICPNPVRPCGKRPW